MGELHDKWRGTLRIRGPSPLAREGSLRPPRRHTLLSDNRRLSLCKRSRGGQTAEARGAARSDAAEGPLPIAAFSSAALHLLPPALRLGEPAERVSSPATVIPKQGRSGELLFVTERQEFRQHGRTCLVEEQDIVYRSGAGSAPRHPAAPDDSAVPEAEGAWRLRLQSDETLLSRFSALTANAHRIHYDTPYCRDVEGHPGLVVHGPLLALLMLELVRRNAPERQVRSLSYRLHRPAFVGEHLLADGTPAGGHTRLRIATTREHRHASGEVTFT